MRVPLERYLEGTAGKVFSLVAWVPFTPIDIDLAGLSRGEWNPLCDRFRIWYIPKVDGQSDKPTSYVILRKLDPDQGVLIFARISTDLEAVEGEGKPPASFTVAVLSNDEVKARSVIGAMLGVPPAYHRRSEVTMLERKWRADPETLAYFLANVQGAVSNLVPGGKVYKLRFEAPPDFMAMMRSGLEDRLNPGGEKRGTTESGSSRPSSADHNP